MRALLVAVSAIAVVSEAGANGIDRAPLRGSAVYEAPSPSYPVDMVPRAYPQPVAVEPGLPPRSAFVPPPRDDWSLPFIFEFGARYWYSFGNLRKRIYDFPESSRTMISRLTYNGLSTHSAEVFARADHPTGLLLKGYGGLTGIQKGALKDEDFPPFIDPYSATLSDQRGGHLNYAVADIGYTVYRTPQASIAGIAGYTFFGQKASAYGCRQTATNPFICSPEIDGTTLAITEMANFHALRLGVAGELTLFDRLRFNAEAAWLPYTKVNGADVHWLRIGSNPGDFTGPIREDGRGDGFQVEATVAWQATKNFSVGAGWRYWHLDTKGNADFGGHVVGVPAAAQPLYFTTDRQGFFVQAAYRLCGACL
jgi:hypothetical protein